VFKARKAKVIFVGDDNSYYRWWYNGEKKIKVKLAAQ
jgi:hypothetical protein